MNDRRKLSSVFGFDLDDRTWFARVQAAAARQALGQVGPYEVIAEVARGGQGTVHRARQPGTQREIAIKRLTAGSFATPEAQSRFEREIRMAGVLNHPHIVTVYGAEVVDGQPILAMEWVDGIPVDRWAAEGPVGRRSVRELLELFVKVCDAVGHAHQRGVIHRDLKPSNILVSDEATRRPGDEQERLASGLSTPHPPLSAQPKILDFGLAKLLQDGSAGMISLTQSEGFMGTPAYASPEQVAGDEIDVRSDIYSLGVILYQMLTGALPHEPQGNIADLFDAIRHAKPARPSSLRADLDAELDAIALKAIAKEKQGRYASLDAFAADIRRYLAGEPVLAHPPSAAYRLRKFVVRHPLPVVLVVTTFVVTLAAALVAGGMAIKLAQRQALLVAAQERERIERLAAERARDQTGAEAAKVRATNDFLLTLLTTNDPVLKLRPDTRLRELLDEAGRSLDAGVLADQPEVQAAVRTTIGRTYTSMKMPREGEPHLRRALAIREGLPQEDRAGLADICAQLALSLSEQRKYAESIPLHRRALALLRSLEPLDEAKLIDMLWRFSTALRDHHELPEAEALAREALERSLRFCGEQHVTTAESRFRLGWILRLTENLEESDQQLREALWVQETLLGTGHPACGETKLRLANTLAAKGQHDAGESLMREALRILEPALGFDNPRVSRAASNLARLLTRRSAYEEAESIYRLNAERAARYYGQQSASVAGALSQQAYVRRLRGDLAGAELLRREALALFQADLGDGHPYTQNERMTLADVLIQQRRFAEAEPLLLDVQARAPEVSDRASERGAVERLIRLYDAWEKAEPGHGKGQEAVRWRQRSQSDNSATQPG